VPFVVRLFTHLINRAVPNRTHASSNQGDATIRRPLAPTSQVAVQQSLA
jgi:hypothetical protein